MTNAEIDQRRQGRDQVQEGRAVPGLLGELQRVGQPDGLEGGRGRVDVVAGRGAARRAGHQRQVRGSADGLPRLVQRQRHRGARRERPRQAAGLLRLPELDVQRLARRHDHAPGLLHRQRRDAAQLDRDERRDESGRRHPVQGRRVRLLVSAASRAARDLPGITGKVGDIKKGSVRDGGSFSQRIGHYSSWNSYFTQQHVSRSSAGTTSSAPRDWMAEDVADVEHGGGGAGRPLRALGDRVST